MTVSDFYKKIFGSKVYKISLDAGCTCPTRDGTKGYGGCIFCSQSGSGDFAASRDLSIEDQIKQAKEKVNRKFSRAAARGEVTEKKYIAYFQNFTNTYGDTEFLLSKYKKALADSEVVGLAIATRPDCLSDEMVFELSKLAKDYFIQIELGLQTSNEITAEYCRRRYSNYEYVSAVKRINAAGNIHLVTHLIFGLPAESEQDMISSVKFVLETNKKDNIKNIVSDFFGIKITSLYVLEGTDLLKEYQAKKYIPLSEEEYLSLIKKTITILPENIVIHRLTGDPPKKLLVAPEWTSNKRGMINKIQKSILEKNL